MFDHFLQCYTIISKILHFKSQRGSSKSTKVKETDKKRAKFTKVPMNEMYKMDAQ